MEGGLARTVCRQCCCGSCSSGRGSFGCRLACGGKSYHGGFAVGLAKLIVVAPDPLAVDPLARCCAVQGGLATEDLPKVFIMAPAPPAVVPLAVGCALEGGLATEDLP